MCILTPVSFDTNSQRRMVFDYLLIKRFSAKVKRAFDK